MIGFEEFLLQKLNRWLNYQKKKKIMIKQQNPDNRILNIEKTKSLSTYISFHKKTESIIFELDSWLTDISLKLFKY